MTSLGFSSISLLNNFTYQSNQQQSLQALEHLSTGLAISRARDNPAGLIASNGLASRLSEIQGQITAIGRNESSLSIEAGTLGATLDQFSDLDRLAVQASNEGGLSSSELGAIQTQAQGILDGVARLSSSTDMDIMNDVTVEMTVGTDELTGNPITETVSLSDLSRVLETDPSAAQELIDGARDAVVERQAEIGMEQNAQAAERRALEEEQINVAQAYSSIRDADYARESSALIRSQILEQASIYTMLATRQSQQATLQLLNLSA